MKVTQYSKIIIKLKVRKVTLICLLVDVFKNQLNIDLINFNVIKAKPKFYYLTSSIT